MNDQDQPDQPQDNARPPEGEGGAKPARVKAEPEEMFPTWETELDIYPLREATQDPRWARWVVWAWVYVCCGLTGGMILLTVLGFWYD